MIEYLTQPRNVAMHDDWFEFARSDHFWVAWRFDALKRLADYLPRAGSRVLEVGCGNGLVLQHLEQELGYIADGCDLNINALQMAPADRAGRLFVYDILEQRAELRQAYQAMFLMDVIEHIEDQRKFLIASADTVVPGGIVVLNVPAFQSLYSVYDTIVGHQRRYSKDSMSALLTSVGLTPLKLCYWGAPLVPLLVLRKAILRFASPENRVKVGFEPPGRLMHSVLHQLRKVENVIPYDPPFGTSLLAIARKNG